MSHLYFLVGCSSFSFWGADLDRTIDAGFWDLDWYPTEPSASAKKRADAVVRFGAIHTANWKQKEAHQLTITDTL